MRVLILTLGTRGDVQPYIALAKGLIGRGHTVAIVTSSSFKGFVEEHGIGFFPIDDGLIEFLDSPEGRQLLDNAANIFAILRSLMRLKGRLGAMYRTQIADTWAAVEGFVPDVLVAHPKTFWAVDFADARGIPVAMSALQPVLVPTGEFPFLLFPRLPIASASWNRMTYSFVSWVSHRSFRKHLRAWGEGKRMADRRPSFLQRRNGEAVPVLYGFSQELVPRPSDWSDSVHVTGFWFLEDVRDDAWQPPTDLERFLADGDPPVYFGFGSMAGQHPERIGRIVVEAVRRTGIRAVVGVGRGGIEIGDETAGGKIFKVGSIPHSWLFDRVAAVVHHGGAGTTAAGLRAGKPTLVCPFGADQPFWGERVSSLGAGLPPVPKRKLTAGRLARAIVRLTTGAEIQRSADRVGEKVRAEDGVSEASRVVEQLVESSGSG